MMAVTPAEPTGEDSNWSLKKPEKLSSRLPLITERSQEKVGLKKHDKQ